MTTGTQFSSSGNDRTPRIFVGSSREGLDIATRLTELLVPDVETQLWTDGFFAPGEFTLESLEARSRGFDGGLIVGTSDDRVISRGEEFESIRDNLLLEYGIFVAIFGRRRALVALENIGDTKVPSDLLGLTCVGFERTDPIDSGLVAAATEIKRAVAAFPATPLDPDVMEGLGGILRVFMPELQAALGASHVGFHCWVIDPRFNPPRLVRVARDRTSPKNRLDATFTEGEGIVGEVWRTAASASIDFREEPYGSITEEDWAGFGTGVRLGMSYELLSMSRERYRSIGATPIKSDLKSGSRVLGCLSYNVGPNIEGVSFEPRKPEVEAILDKAAELVRIVLQSQ